MPNSRSCLALVLAVLAACDANTLAPDARFSTVVAPALPDSFTAAFAVDRNILNWRHTSGDAVRFHIQRRDLTGDPEAWTAWGADAKPAGDARMLADTSMPLGHRHNYRIRACNAAGCTTWVFSGAMASASDSAPGAPTNFAVEFGDTQYELTWTAGSGTARRFQIQRRERATSADAWTRFIAIADAAGDTTSQTDAAVTPGAEHHYRIRACNIGGCSAWVRTPDVLTAEPDATTHEWKTAGAGYWQAGRNWAPGHAPASGDTVIVQIAGAAAYLRADATVSRVKVATTASVRTNGHHLAITGGLHVRGGMLVVSGGSLTIGE